MRVNIQPEWGYTRGTASGKISVGLAANPRLPGEAPIRPHPLLSRVARVAVAATALLCPVSAAQGAEESPEQVAAQLLQAMRDTNWLRAASLMHPSALAQFHDLFRPVLQCDNPAVAQARQELFGIGSGVEAARTSDTALVASLLRFGTNQEQGFAEALRTAQLSVIGHIPEGADTVHVLARISMSVDSLPFSQVEVISFRRYGSTWRTLLKADISAMGAMLRRLCVTEG